jgi:hypothetical protein
MDKETFQQLGERERQRLGIDGTAGDAQDVKHSFIAHPALPGTCCVACGLTPAARVHR